MSNKENQIKYLIQDYLNDEGILRGKINDPKLEFGYKLSFPPGLDPGHKMNLIMPKHKDFIIISVGIQISKDHVDALNDQRMDFYMSLRKSFLLKDVFFQINIPNNRYKIDDQVFLKENGRISKNSLYRSIKRVFNCAMFGNMLLVDFCSGKIKSEDFEKSKDFTSGSDFSLYS